MVWEVRGWGRVRVRNRASARVRVRARTMFRARAGVRVRARARTRARARVAAVDPYKSNSQQNLSVSEKYCSCRPICIKIGTNIYDLLKRRVQ